MKCKIYLTEALPGRENQKVIFLSRSNDKFGAIQSNGKFYKFHDVDELEDFFLREKISSKKNISTTLKTFLDIYADMFFKNESYSKRSFDDFSRAIWAIAETY